MDNIVHIVSMSVFLSPLLPGMPLQSFQLLRLFRQAGARHAGGGEETEPCGTEGQGHHGSGTARGSPSQPVLLHCDWALLWAGLC